MIKYKYEKSDFSDLEKSVVNVIKHSPMGNKLESVYIDSSEYGDDGEFIRVVIHARDLHEISEEELDDITRTIEEDISKYDDRFASVRFSN